MDLHSTATSSGLLSPRVRTAFAKRQPAEPQRATCRPRLILIFGLLAALWSARTCAEPRIAQRLESITYFERLPVECAPTQQGAIHPTRASLRITLQKLSAQGNGASPSRLTFWYHGTEHFSTRIWSPTEPRGTLKTLRFYIATLPPLGGPVLINSGRGLRLLHGRDFSFSVTGPTAMLTAQLIYHCAGDAFAFATVEPVSVLADYRSGHLTTGLARTSRRPAVVRPQQPIPKERDTGLGRLPTDPAFE